MNLCEFFHPTGSQQCPCCVFRLPGLLLRRVLPLPRGEVGGWREEVRQVRKPGPGRQPGQVVLQAGGRPQGHRGVTPPQGGEGAAG